MGLISTEVEVNANSQMIKYYEDLGYKIPRYTTDKGKYIVKQGTKIKIKVEDLQDYSNILVDVQCDHCGKIVKDIQWHYYKKSINKYSKYYCRKCVDKLFRKEKELRTKLKNSKSFGQWCYDNLSRKEADLIIIRWNNELNIDKKGNKLSPFDVTYSSAGINKKGYWFKCLEHPEHKSEQKSIDRFTSGNKGSIICNQCNSISITHPELIKYLVNKEDALKYSYGSHEKVPMKCPDCGHERGYRIPELLRGGFYCPICSDKAPYSEKFLANLLKQILNQNFNMQLTRKFLKWCANYRYDFYINHFSCIIETHGLQHYKLLTGNWKFKFSLEEIQKNDMQKELLAKNNNIKHYIILDCRYSDMKWIKNSVMESELPDLLNFKEDDIDWGKCHEYACSNLVKTVSDIWKNEKKSIIDIADELKIGIQATRKYLKQGTELGWCNYNSKKIGYVKVICLTTGEIFDSITNAGKKYNIKSKDHISDCCNKKRSYCGKHPETGEKLEWAYYK